MTQTETALKDEVLINIRIKSKYPCFGKYFEDGNPNIAKRFLNLSKGVCSEHGVPASEIMVLVGQRGRDIAQWKYVKKDNE